MQAGLLAIAGGKQIFLSADGSKQSDEDEQLLAPRQFRNIIEAAQQAVDADDLNTKEKILKQLAAGDIQRELRLADLEAKLPDIIDMTSLQGAVTMPPHLQVLLGGEEDFTVQSGLWSITDSYSGSLAMESGLPLRQIVVLSDQAEGQAGELLELAVNVESDELDVLFDGDMTNWQEMLEQMLMQHELTEANAEEALPLVTFAQIPMPNWHAGLQERKLETIQFIDVTAGRGAALAQPLVDAIAADDFSLLSDADLAKLDALIEQIGQHASKRTAVGLGDFRQMIHENFAAQAGSTDDPVEQMQLSSLSASHSSNQTGSQDDRLGLRVIQATPMSHDKATAAPADQVRVSITQAIQAGMDRVQIQLEPAELGRVEIRLDLSQDGRAQLHIQADNRDTLDMLQRDARALERALLEAGIDADTRDMEFNLSEGNSGEEQTGTNDAKTMSQSETGEEELTSMPQNEVASHYTLSIAQGLDIKV